MSEKFECADDEFLTIDSKGQRVCRKKTLLDEIDAEERQKLDEEPDSAESTESKVE